MMPLLIGTALSIAALVYVLYPLLRDSGGPRDATADGAPVCPACGARPEPDAVYCSNCGRALSAPEAMTTS